MAESRRGFLKTLGKLATAVGITTAAATLPAAPKAKIPTTPKAKFEGGFTGFKKPITHASNSHTVNRDKLRGGLNWGQGSPTAEAQKAIDAIENLRLDNITAEIRPNMFYGPPHLIEELRFQSALQRLDPFNWGDVFSLKWTDWHTMADRWSYQAAWKAYVKPEYQCLFKDHIYTQSCQLPLEYLRQRVKRDEGIKTHVKERTYYELVESLKLIIKERRDLGKA